MIQQKQLILHNDSKNTVDFVRACLIRYCEHEFMQAEQLVVLAQGHKKASIKEGDFLELHQIQQKLIKKGLTVELIEKVELCK